MATTDTSFITGITLSCAGAFLNAINRTVTRVAMSKSGRGAGNFSYLSNATWWWGMVCMAAGETLTFLALALAPAALVSPIVGALTVLFGVVLARRYLSERVPPVARLGCFLSVVGVVVVGNNAPQDSGVRDVTSLLFILSSPLSLLYLLTSSLVIYLILTNLSNLRASTNILVLACAGGLTSSLLVSAAKVLSLAISPFTSSPDSQTSNPPHPYTTPIALLAALACAICVIIGIHILTKLLTHFPSSRVVSVTFPVYVMGQMLGGALIFHEWDGVSVGRGVNVACGFMTSAVAVAMMCLTSAESGGGGGSGGGV